MKIDFVDVFDFRQNRTSNSKRHTHQISKGSTFYWDFVVCATVADTDAGVVAVEASEHLTISFPFAIVLFSLPFILHFIVRIYHLFICRSLETKPKKEWKAL